MTHEWISVTDANPKDNQEVIAQIRGKGIGHFVYRFSPFTGKMCFAASERFIVGHDFDCDWFEPSEVVQWVPLPEPPT